MRIVKESRLFAGILQLDEFISIIFSDNAPTQFQTYPLFRVLYSVAVCRPQGKGEQGGGHRNVQ